jgi:serine protease AprX
MRHNRLGATARVQRLLRGVSLGAAATIVALVAGAASSSATAATAAANTYVPRALVERAQANPTATFRVIVQGSNGSSSGDVAGLVRSELLSEPGRALGLRRRFATLSGVAVEVTGRQLLKLASKMGIAAITEDAPVRLSALSSKQQWPFVSTVASYWPKVTNSSLQAPTIAVVDSGIDATRGDFGGRVVKQVTLTSSNANSPGDGRGHGTFVAGIAAGSAQGYTGSAPNAKLVSIDVLDDEGMALTSDVIAAADWIYQNKAAYGIRVANFSLHTSAPASVFFDPLDRAVERLWFGGVVVVAAAGNYGSDGMPTRVAFAPGNDPFVITIGAGDTSGSVSTNDDIAAPWSVYGYTLDGFAKPELAAPGRYMVGPVPPASTLVAERPNDVVALGYMQLSGTSFAAPVVAGAAADVLARHPSWTPDQVKGALMVSAKPTPNAAPLSEGVGEVDAARAGDVADPPNPNAALNRFLVPDPAGGSTPVFDAASWGSAARSDASWGSASWGSASWGSASWDAASWGSAAWSSSSWDTASWGSASWGSSSWGSASWGSTSSADNAVDDRNPDGGYWLEPFDGDWIASMLGITVAADGSVTDTAPVTTVAAVTLP